MCGAWVDGMKLGHGPACFVHMNRVLILALALVLAVFLRAWVAKRHGSEQAKAAYLQRVLVLADAKLLPGFVLCFHAKAVALPQAEVNNQCVSKQLHFPHAEVHSTFISFWGQITISVL